MVVYTVTHNLPRLFGNTYNVHSVIQKFSKFKNHKTYEKSLLVIRSVGRCFIRVYLDVCTYITQTSSIENNLPTYTKFTI